MNIFFCDWLHYHIIHHHQLHLKSWRCHNQHYQHWITVALSRSTDRPTLYFIFFPFAHKAVLTSYNFSHSISGVSLTKSLFTPAKLIVNYCTWRSSLVSVVRISWESFCATNILYNQDKDWACLLWKLYMLEILMDFYYPRFLYFW